MPIELLDRIAARLGFRRDRSAQVAGLVDLLWNRFLQLSPAGQCPTDPAEARGFVRAYAAAVVRSELVGSNVLPAKQDELEDRVICRLIERFLSERPIRSEEARPARAAA